MRAAIGCPRVVVTAPEFPLHNTSPNWNKSFDYFPLDSHLDAHPSHIFRGH